MNLVLVAALFGILHLSKTWNEGQIRRF
ncbi:MAG: hypothetical protein RIT39_678, partial [Bacteroidota bacterium]